MGRDVLPQGGPPHQHCCWEIHLSPGQAGRSVLCWKCKARLMSRAGVCCAPLSARRMLVQNPPTQLSPSTGEHRLCPGQGAEQGLINGFVFPVAQQGEDHTPTLSMENSQTPLIRCAEKWPQTCHILSCIPSLQRLCSPAPVPAPHFGFPVPSTACLAGKLRQQRYDRSRGHKCSFELICCITSPWTGPGGQGEVQNPAGCSPTPLEELRIPGLKIETR